MGNLLPFTGTRNLIYGIFAIISYRRLVVYLYFALFDQRTHYYLQSGLPILYAGAVEYIQ